MSPAFVLIEQIIHLDDFFCCAVNTPKTLYLGEIKAKKLFFIINRKTWKVFNIVSQIIIFVSLGQFPLSATLLLAFQNCIIYLILSIFYIFINLPWLSIKIFQVYEWISLLAFWIMSKV